MKRLVVLGILFSAGALSISAAALQAPAGGGQPAPRVVTVEKLRDNLYMMAAGRRREHAPSSSRPAASLSSTRKIPDGVGRCWTRSRS